MDRVAEKIVRALYFWKTNKVLDSASMRFHWQPKDWLKSYTNTLLAMDLVNVDPKVFSCRFKIAAKEALFCMMFYRAYFYVVTVNLATEGVLESHQNSKMLV